MSESKIGPVNIPESQVSIAPSFRYTVKDTNNQGQSDTVINSNCDKKETLVENNCSESLNISEKSLVSDAHSDVASKEMTIKASEENSSIGSKSNNSHSRQSSDTCHTSISGLSDIKYGDIGNCVQGSIVGLHRKMVSRFYFN